MVIANSKFIQEEDKKYFAPFVEGELFDLTLYQALAKIETDDSLREILSELVEVEKKHLNFWQEVSGITEPKFSVISKIKLRLILFARKVFGEAVTIIILELIEIYGIRKYFNLWKKYQNHPLANEIEEILNEEFSHEEKAIVERSKRQIISVTRIRNAIFGFNDGFVEILVAFGGFLAVFKNYFLVGIAGLIVGIAGSISMATGAFLAVKSEKEIEEIEQEKKRILKIKTEESIRISEPNKPLSAGLVVGFSYFLGVFLPVLPFLLGAEKIYWPILVSILIVFLLSYLTAFFAGENFFRRLRFNFLIIVGAILISYLGGYLAKRFLGVAI